MGITIKFKPGNRRSQAGAADLFAIMGGRKPPAKCADCGGVLPEEVGDHCVPQQGICDCPVDDGSGS